MIVGVPKEIKIQEYRVGLVPAGVKELIKAGATVLVEKGAGLGSGIADQQYIEVGAKIVDTPEQVWKQAQLIIKVKEPIASEFDRIQPQQIIYTFFHLAVAPELANVLVEKKVTAIAYETIEDHNRALPLLKPMSEVAGKMAAQIGASWLQKENGGRGVLLGGVPGIDRGKVTIIGGGVVGINACKVAVGLGANVTVIDVDIHRLEYLDDVFGSKITTLKSNTYNIERSVVTSDLLIGAVLLPGARAPKLVTKEMISKMRKGSVIVDVAVDQGGCVETCKPTTFDQPTFFVDGVLHYCVANMPGAVPNSSTYALTNATLGYARKMVEKGFDQTLSDDYGFQLGVNAYKGHITYQAVAQALEMPFRELSSLIV